MDLAMELITLYEYVYSWSVFEANANAFLGSHKSS